MAKIINLRGVRKARKRNQDAARGDQNAAKFGESKVTKTHRAAREALDTKVWDAHRREFDKRK